MKRNDEDQVIKKGILQLEKLLLNFKATEMLKVVNIDDGTTCIGTEEVIRNTKPHWLNLLVTIIYFDHRDEIIQINVSKNWFLPLATIKAGGFFLYY